MTVVEIWRSAPIEAGTRSIKVEGVVRDVQWATSAVDSPVHAIVMVPPADMIDAVSRHMDLVGIPSIACCYDGNLSLWPKPGQPIHLFWVERHTREEPS
jgi:hypothetical protein